MTVTTERIGARVYVAGNTYGIRNALKAVDCHWDGERHQWWIGATKAEKLAAVLARAESAEVPSEDLDRARIYSKVRYKGRTYYTIARARDGARLRLTTLDGSLTIWADAPECETLKVYEVHEYRGHTRYQTLGGLRRFVEQARRDEELARTKTPSELETLGWARCWECSRLLPPDMLDSSGYCGC